MITLIHDKSVFKIVSTAFEGGWRVAVGNEVPYSLKEYKGKEKSNKRQVDSLEIVLRRAAYDDFGGRHDEVRILVFHIRSAPPA